MANTSPNKNQAILSQPLSHEEKKKESKICACFLHLHLQIIFGIKASNIPYWSSQPERLCLSL